MVDFEKLVKKIKNILRKELVLLWFFALAAGFALIILQNYNKLPLGKGDFVFLSILALLVALYKPRWIFFLFVGSLAFENIILASGFLPVQLRPYQFLGGVLILAIAILFVSKQLKFKILKPTWIDWTIFSLVPLSFLSLLNSPVKNISLKNNLVLASFILLYFLIRNFLRNRSDLLKTAFFFFGSFFVVATYGFYQVFADKFLAYRQAGGAKSFEVMFGRPNSTFAEPDWLGIYLGFALAVFLGFIFYFSRHKQKTFLSRKYVLFVLDVLVFLDIILIILTLSRSAWVGSAAVIFFYLLTLMPKHGPASDGKHIPGWKGFYREAIIVLSIIVLSFVAIHFGKISKFDILDRARSTATNEQKITIACENGATIPQIVSSTDELRKYDCRHINLEEIDSYKSQGKIVAETFRQDPNVMTRSAIYQKSWKIISEHPLLGVGFGTITQSLGTDERGTGLNESNVFLQVWAGCGILGLAVFIAIFGYLFFYAFRRVSPICPLNKLIGCPVACPVPITVEKDTPQKTVRRSRFNLFVLNKRSTSQDWCGVKDNFEKTLHVFAVLGMLALIIPNLFNAGLLMGLFWLGLAVIISLRFNLSSGEG
jgi:hypothetical protein